MFVCVSRIKGSCLLCLPTLSRLHMANKTGFINIGHSEYWCLLVCVSVYIGGIKNNINLGLVCIKT